MQTNYLHDSTKNMRGKNWILRYSKYLITSVYAGAIFHDGLMNLVN